MRIMELTGQPGVPITNEETEVYELIEQAGSVAKQQLNPRQLILVDNLIRKNVIVRKVADGNITYKVSSRI